MRTWKEGWGSEVVKDTELGAVNPSKVGLEGKGLGKVFWGQSTGVRSVVEMMGQQCGCSVDVRLMAL